MRKLIVLLLAVSLTACGFQLRGSFNLPWTTFHIGQPENSEIYAQLKRGIEAGGQTRVVTDIKEAQASLVVLRNDQIKSILSLSATGLVREFQLTRTFTYRVVDPKGQEIVPTASIILQRQMTFDDTHLFAKEAEEAVITRDIQNDLVQQLLRRLAAAKPRPVEAANQAVAQPAH